MLLDVAISIDLPIAARWMDGDELYIINIDRSEALSGVIITH